MLHELARGVQAVEAGHANVNDDHVGLQTLGHFHGFAAIRRLSANFPAFMFLEQRT